MDNIEERQVEKWKDMGNIDEKLNSEKIWTIWKKSKSNSEKDMEIMEEKLKSEKNLENMEEM